MKLHHGKASDRAGYALVLFVMIFFGLMGLAALVIAMGFARLAQREMQTAVDSAALEGLRDLYSTTGGTAGGGQDAHRRQQASNIVVSLFTDEVDSGGNTVYYGAGPVLAFSGSAGSSDLAAGQTMTLSGTPVYQPGGLQLNYPDNATNGDMVAGAYGPNANYDPTQLADEDADYNRRDFTPSSGTSESASAPAFLVRMRRTPLSSVPDSLDNSADSSGGPTLPVLFGRGSMMARSGTGTQLSVASGITVRATAIAGAGDNITFSGTSGTYSAGRAKTAGRSYAIPASGVTIPGVAPFALESGFWASCCSGTTSITATLMSTAGSNVEIVGPNGAIVGLLLSTGTDATSHVAASATAIGQPPSLAIADSTGAFDDSALRQDGVTGGGVIEYVPIYTMAPLAGQSRTIIGFGFLSQGQWSYTPPVAANPQTGQPAQPATLTISAPGTNQPAYPVASQNASGVIGLAIPVAFTTNPHDLSTLFRLHEGTAVTDQGGANQAGLANSLYAPVLVNRYIGPNP